MRPKEKTYARNRTGDLEQATSAGSAFLSRAIFYFLLVFFFGVSIYVVFFSPFLELNNIEIEGNKEIASGEILDKVEGISGQNFMRLIPRDNYLLLPQSKIEEGLKNEFKKISSVQVSKKFPSTLSIQITERKALLVWCAGEDCYIVDENGIAYAKADFESPEILQNNLVRIIDQSARPISLGQAVVDSDYVNFAMGIRDALKQQTGLEVNGQYQTPSRMAEELDVATTDGTNIFFSTQFPLDEAVGALGAVLKKQIKDSDKNNLDYVDLRSENKVFYKFKSAEPEQQAAPTDNSEEK
jgi:cell division septal protein FtsQ